MKLFREIDKNNITIVPNKYGDHWRGVVELSINTNDPFKVYKPIHLGMMGIIFVGLPLAMSMLIYRPWCHLFCPFGLVGWFVEKLSLVKISVDYKTCIGCGKCETACPSTVMGAILRQDKKTIPSIKTVWINLIPIFLQTIFGSINLVTYIEEAKL